ncbi:hypothetical protein [Streptomyces boluensis]|uniref:hypothetical protein n=1 Tax=Streptomyces boluensis TaxID=1775135 RepID=UPI0016529F11|nr:hypothetical protein [Streptomyces boluensis]
MSFTVYTIEMAYAHMRQLQELANRSRAHLPADANGRAAARSRRSRGAKKR